MSEGDKDIDNRAIGPSALMVGRRVDFGTAGEGEGLAWGVEAEIDITDSLVRTRLQESRFVIPPHIKKIIFLELAPQEALLQKNVLSDHTLNPVLFVVVLRSPQLLLLPIPATHDWKKYATV